MHLLVHEASFGGMSPYAAKRLRRLGRLATVRGTDKKINYARSYIAATFVTYFAQRLSSACVMYTAPRAFSARSRKPVAIASATPPRRGA